MSWSQTLVVSWVQFVVAAALLLGVARAAMRWVVQPAERIRLIQCAFVASLAVPLLLASAPVPAWRLELISTAPFAAVDEVKAVPKLNSMPSAAASTLMPPGVNEQFPLSPEESE